MQSGSGSGGSPEVITGIYTGADAATVIVTVEGKSETATIVKLGAHPPSLVYYVTWPTAVPPGAGGSGMLGVEAFDTNGHPLAKL
jgi:hypothetical protein